MPESRRKITFSGILKLLVLCAGACAMLYPFVFMILSSFKNNAEIIRNPPTFIPEVFTWDNSSKLSILRAAKKPTSANTTQFNTKTIRKPRLIWMFAPKAKAKARIMAEEINPRRTAASTFPIT